MLKWRADFGTPFGLITIICVSDICCVFTTLVGIHCTTIIGLFIMIYGRGFNGG